MASEWNEVVQNKYGQTIQILEDFNVSYINSAKELARTIFANIKYAESCKEMFASNFPDIVASVVLYMTGMMHENAPILEDLIELSKLRNKLAFEKKIKMIENYIDPVHMEEVKQSLVSTRSKHEKELVLEIVVEYMQTTGDIVNIKSENALQKSTASNRYNIMLEKFVDTTLCLLSDIEHIFCGKASSIICKVAVLFIGNECLFATNAEAPNMNTYDKLKDWFLTGLVSRNFITKLESMRKWLNRNIIDAENVILSNIPVFKIAEVHVLSPPPNEDVQILVDAGKVDVDVIVEVECTVILPPATP
jgi:hypothetical protein